MGNNQVLTQGQVESELMRLSAGLEEETYRYASLCEAEAEADIEYKAKSNVLLIHEANKDQKVTVGERNARVAMLCRDEFAVYRMAEARRAASKELLVSLRQQIDALRTLSANIRAQS